jgi:hypothetical protein
LDPTAKQFLAEAARVGNTTPDAILRTVFHLGSDKEPAVRGFFPHWEGQLLQLLLDLDYAVRTHNPGLHYVDRGTYLGYRREGRSESILSERSQVFLSVLKRVGALTTVLPLEPNRFKHIKNVRDLSKRGHHGIGTLEFVISDEVALAEFLHVFDPWLRR